MPLADVQINITRMRRTINVTMDSEFHITTNTTQNVTLAFVYPSVPYSTYLLYDDTNESKYMNIYVNNTQRNYGRQDYSFLERIGFTFDFLEEYPFITRDVVFAFIRVELVANTTLILSTESGVVFESDMNQFEYSYIVGSARSFEGHTLEQVHFRVVEEVPFLSKEFAPNDSLSITEDGGVTDAAWAFNITEFPSDVVSFQAGVKSNDRFQAIDMIVIGAPVIFILGVIWLRYKRVT